jgi:hypothetical protein
MQQTVSRILSGMLALVVMPLAAQLPDADVVFDSDPEGADITVNEMVEVVTGIAQPQACLAPLAVNRIDGEPRAVPARGFLIEPGVHSINGRATLDIEACPLQDANQQIYKTADLEVNFETGVIYHIAYDHSSANSEDWALVVWKTEQLGPVETEPAPGEDLPFGDLPPGDLPGSPDGVQ